MTVAVSLPGNEKPDVADLETALTWPARPLFLGRKTCLPSTPILIKAIHARNVLEALQSYPRYNRQGIPMVQPPMDACWPAGLDTEKAERIVSVYDRRDWKNQVHTGSRRRAEGFIQEVKP